MSRYHKVVEENNELKVQLESAQLHIQQLEKQAAEAKDNATCIYMERLPDEVQRLQLESENASAAQEQELRALRVQNSHFQSQLGKVAEELSLKQHENDLFRSDFHREREDRTLAQNRLHDLEQALSRRDEELSATRELLGQYTQNALVSARDRRNDAMRRIREDYNREHPFAPARPVTYVSRGHGIVVCDGEDERPLQEDEDIIDSLVEPGDHVPSDDNSLQCPKCNASFAIDNHVQFLDHVDSCHN